MKSFVVRIIYLALAMCVTFGKVAADSPWEANLLSSEIRLPLTNGKKVTAQRTSGADLGKGNFSWTGEVTGGVSGFATLARVDGWLSGTVQLSDGKTSSFRGSEGHLQVTSVATKARPCGGCRIRNGSTLDPRRQRRIKTWRNGDGNLVDLLVVYPSAVVDEATGTTPLAAAVAKAVADANLCYRNSQVNLQLRLVHLAEVSYTPTDVLETDLERLEGTADGYMDDIHALRDKYGADLVALLTTDSDSGGLASSMMHPALSFESQGFSVSVWDQIGAPSYTLAHELGHNMGCLHNREDASTESSTDSVFNAFNYGERWLDGGKGYATIMSYDTKPISTYPNTVPYFSNPNIFYLGTATGEAGAKDNAQVLRFTAPYVANFRTANIQGIVPMSSSVTVKEGNSTSFNIRLAVKPVSTTTVTASLTDGGDADLILSGPTSLTFDSGNWNLPHPIQVSAHPDDDSTDGSAILTLSATGMTSATVTVMEEDAGATVASERLVSGVVTNSLGVGVPDVTLAFSDSGGSVATDANGSFRHLLPVDWSGSITPSKAGYAFSPTSTPISALVSDSVGHAFEGTRSSILYVDADATGAGDGSSWAAAYVDLAEALRSEHPFDEVWVAEGTYEPGIVRPAAFLLPPGLPVYGGFVGTEDLRDERNATTHPTILSGDLGTDGDSTDNAYHVIIPSAGSILDGFTIRDGNASENFSDDRGQGGALWAENVDFVVSNCTFTGHYAYQKGGAVYVKDANATFTNCFFNNNLTGPTGDGGAIHANTSSVTFASCIFMGNQADYVGGAINSLNSQLVLSSSRFVSNQSISSNGGGAINVNGGSLNDSGSVFLSNKATHQGGAIQWEGAGGSLVDSNFTNNENTSWNGGGAIYLKNASPTISGCSFTGNLTKANTFGGAIRLVNASPTISDCIFTRNVNEVNSGGALSVDATSVPILAGNDFRYNSTPQYGGAIYLDGSQQIEVSDGLFLGNSAESGGAFSAWGTNGLTFTNCRFLGNEANASAGSEGGVALLASGAASTTFVNCAISGNKANYRNGVLKIEGTTRFVNCSLTGNSAGDLGGITILFDGDSVAFGNCILWGNSATGSGDDVFVNSQTAIANNSLFDPSKSTDTLSGSGNLSSDPLFTDADGLDNVAGTDDDDLTLQPFSPAIDKASGAAANYSSTDILGKTRYGDHPDMGAYEYRVNSAPIVSSGETYSLSILEDQSSSTTFAATDVDEDALTWSVFTQAGNGIASVGASMGTVSYVPNADWSGSDSFVLQVSDGTATAEISVTVTVAPVNDSPGITNSLTNGVLTANIPENNATVLTLVAADVESDNLTFSMSGTDSGLFDLNATTGVLSFKEPPDFENPSDASEDNTYELSVAVSDGNATSSIPVRVNITNKNDPPRITQGAIASLSVSEDITSSATYLATDEDVDVLTWSVLTQARNGIVSVVASTGTASYAPHANWFGSDSFVLQVSDGTAVAEILVTVTVTPVNDPPSITNALADGVLTASAAENNATVLTIVAVDVESDNLTFSMAGTDSGLFDLNATTGVLSFKVVPDYENPGDANTDNTYELSVAVSDGNDTSLPTTVKISVINLAENEWTFAEDKGDGWRAFSWFGNYYETSTGWIYHEYHSWLYRTGDATSSIWFYDPDPALGWLWTNADVYPYFYRNTTTSWLYYEPDSKGPRKFYDYDSRSWSEY